MWLKIGGDKGGGTFKMCFQIVNVPTPNSVHNTCVFSCFAAGNSVTNFHVALDCFKDQVEHLHGMKWRYIVGALQSYYITIYKFYKLQATQSRCLFAETTSSCQRCMVCQEPVVCVYTNEDIMTMHTIGCYPCLYCKIPSDQMATPLSVRGHANRKVT